MQTLDLVEGRWSALLNGDKLDTIRWNEGAVEPGFLLYQSYPGAKRKAVVFVTDVRTIPLREVLKFTIDVQRKPNEQTLLERMQAHYPDITLDTKVIYVRHLSVAETAANYPAEVEDALSRS